MATRHSPGIGWDSLSCFAIHWNSLLLLSQGSEATGDTSTTGFDVTGVKCAFGTHLGTAQIHPCTPNGASDGLYYEVTERSQTIALTFVD